MNALLTGPAGEFIDALYRFLAHRWTTWVGLMAMAVGVVLSLGDGGLLPVVERPVVQLGVALAGASFIARSVSVTRARLVGAGAVVLGVLLLMVGARTAGTSAGEAVLGEAPMVEAYDRLIQGQRVPAHLGAPLWSTLDAGQVGLRLGVGQEDWASATLVPGSAAEVALGPWAVHLKGVQQGHTPATARLVATPRAGGEPVKLSVPPTGAGQLPDGTRVVVERITTDFGKALGAAARIRVDWQAAEDEEGRTEVAWHFVDHPDLDARLGASPWALTLEALDVAPQVILGVRQAGSTMPALAGWALLALGVLMLGLGRPEEEAA